MCFLAKLFQVFSHWSWERQSQLRFQSTRTASRKSLLGQPAGKTDLVMEVAPRPKKKAAPSLPLLFILGRV